MLLTTTTDPMLFVFFGIVILFLGALFVHGTGKEKSTLRFVLHPGFRKLNNGNHEFCNLDDLVNAYQLDPKKDWIIEYNSKTYLQRGNDIWLYPPNEWEDAIKIIQRKIISKRL